MPRACDGRIVKRAAADTSAPSKPYDIPYFAHQQLDPAHFPECIGMPVGGPAFKPLPYGAVDVGNGAWVDTDDEIPAETGDEPVLKKSKAASRSSPTNQLTGSSFKKIKVTGGRPALAKKVTADLDSDDELIMTMKNAKYQEKDIAERLVKEGRIAYNPKTIGTRYARLRRALQKQQDEMLDNELTDWHDGDDDVLRQAVAKADEDVRKAKEAVDARKWRIVADAMKTIKPVVNFSQRACAARYNALEAGSAKPTPESVTEPDEQTLARIQSRIDKEAEIEELRLLPGAVNRANLEANSWTSKMREYY